MKRPLLVLAATTLGVIAIALVVNVTRPRAPQLPPDELTRLRAVVTALEPLQTDMPTPRPGDWLSQHTERGQTFEQYTAARPVTARPDDPRRVIYIQNIGPFTDDQRRVVQLTADYMRHCFGLDVRFLDDLPVGDDWPADARRTHPTWGDDQLLTTHILHDVLRPRLPDDGAVILGFTALDLWPGKGWNFVFGQALLRGRAGVWSIYRNGNPSDPGPPSDPAAPFTLCLRRTLKTAVHETGHMFSIHHCTAAACVMNGSNHREESDAQPLWFCAQCTPKLAYATGLDLAARYDQLIDFCRTHRLDDTAEHLERCRAAIATEHAASD